MLAILDALTCVLAGLNLCSPDNAPTVPVRQLQRNTNDTPKPKTFRPTGTRSTISRELPGRGNEPKRAWARGDFSCGKRGKPRRRFPECLVAAASDGVVLAAAEGTERRAARTDSGALWLTALFACISTLD